jgi:heat shock protein HtpX
MKRIILFLATNLAILVVLSIVMSVLGISSRSMTGMLMIAFVFGMGGSFISLAISKWMAKKSTGAQVIETPSNETERWLVETVRKQAEKAGIGMPEVAIYDGPEMNAFATGMNKNNALVAVSTGLLQNMSRDEVEAVLGHEVSHVANGDMVTLALIQGILNTFVIFIARVIAGIVSSAMRGDEEEVVGFDWVYLGVALVMEIILGVLASIVVMWFSRQREFRADNGGATLAGRQKMIAALQRLQGGQDSQLPGELVALGISGKSNLMALFSSHPPLEDRIASLQRGG